MRREDGRFDWDVTLGRRWVVLLFCAYLMPLALPGLGSKLWIWPWSTWEPSEPVDVLVSLVPVLLGVAAWILLGLSRRRLRGALLFVACAASMLLPCGRMFQRFGSSSIAWELFLRVGWQGLALTLGLAAVVAGNRQQKRSLGRGFAPWIAGVGGLALLAVFFVPIGFGGLADRAGESPMVASVFLEREAWSHAWPVLCWLLGLLALGTAGALSPLAARIGEPLQTSVENTISRLARLLPLTLPIVLLGLYIAYGVPGLGTFFLLLAKVILHGYAVVVLMTIGLARSLDGVDAAYVARLFPEGEEPDASAGEPAATPA